MAKLPYSRVINVNLTRNQAFPTRRGFGVQLILTNTAVAGKLDASNRTRVYGTMEEVAVDHASNTPFYSAALEAFSQNPRPVQIKAGFVSAATPATMTTAAMSSELDAIYDQDSEWYWITIGNPALRDIAALDALVTWTEAKEKLAIIDTNDIGHQTPGNTTTISARHRGTVDRSATFYHTSSAEFPGVALAAVLSTFNFDEANSAYTAKFKRLNGVAPVNLGSAAVQSITGFVPQLGQSPAAGHNSNTYIDVGGRQFVAEGSTLNPNLFIDEIHASDWIIARTEEEMLGMFLNNKRIPFTDAGMEILAAGPRTVMALANRAGLIANDLDPLTGDYAPAVEITVPSVFSVPEAQRKARIAPAIAVRFRYAGAVHYTVINYHMTF